MIGGLLGRWAPRRQRKSEIVNARESIRVTGGKYRLDLPREKLELELIQTQMAQKPMLRAEVGMRVRCANKASAE